MTTKKPTARIELHTRLHEGIYPSYGGGQDRVVATYPATPRGLIRAIQHLQREREKNRVGYGTIGCGASWLVLPSGREVTVADIDAVMGAPRTHREAEREAARNGGSSYIAATRLVEARAILEGQEAGRE